MIFYLNDGNNNTNNIINYEIDGSSHLFPTSHKPSFTKCRDEYLQNMNINKETIKIKVERKYNNHPMKLVKVNNIQEYKLLASKVISNLNLKIDKQISQLHK